ncbi:MAG: hypothetical protein CSA19_01445 [Deltaproteobacteria bacterium]|nr:MAG: hypothetical protein CSA19_01445 [Deltaproteobacteria bacterium]
MAFVNEYVTEADNKRYNLDELWARYNGVLSQKLPDKKCWVIDREKEIWLLDTGRIPDPDLDHAYLPEQIWTLHYQGDNIEVRIQVSDDKEIAGKQYKRVWDLLALSSDALENLQTELLLQILEEMLKTYGYMGLTVQRSDYSVALRDCREGGKL